MAQVVLHDRITTSEVPAAGTATREPSLGARNTPPAEPTMRADSDISIVSAACARATESVVRKQGVSVGIKGMPT